VVTHITVKHVLQQVDPFFQSLRVITSVNFLSTFILAFTLRVVSLFVTFSYKSLCVC
jgi:hypothetical protein